MNASRRLYMIAGLLQLCAGTVALAGGFAGLGSNARGFAEVVPGKTLVFPEDLGAHPDFRIEWWYLTANLKDDSGASYGIQWTLFRQALEPGLQREGWGNQQVWMGHAAVTTTAEHLFSQTFARGGVGQAGVIATPFRTWVDDWSFSSIDLSPGAGLSRVKVSASGPNFRYFLNLTAKKPLVLHGDHGFSRKSERGQASYYYSQPFFLADGILTIRGRKVRVSGEAWMDREWSSQPLAPDQKGWDWFSLHLAGGDKLMLFRLRSEEASGFVAGTWITSDGTAQALGSDDIVLTPLSESSVAGRMLPTAWKVQVKSRGLEIEITSLNPLSWMATSFPYWEGPVSFVGSYRGRGYLEMTGY